MPTQNDLFQAQMLQQLSQNIRGGLGARQARFDKKEDFERALQVQGQRQSFQTGERLASQEFAAGQTQVGQQFAGEQQALRLQSAEEQAQIRAQRPQTKINLEIKQQKQQEVLQEQGKSLQRAGFIEIDPAGGGVQLTKESIGKLVNSKNQASFLRDQIINIEGLSDEEFENSKENLSATMKSLKKEARRLGVKTPLPDILIIKEGETKQVYLKRIRNFRKSLIDREIQRRIDKEDFTKVITSTSLGGVRFRKATEAEEVAQRKRAIPRLRRDLRKEIEKEFGGEIE